jgi:demethylspheroidene O-methyltransferase
VALPSVFLRFRNRLLSDPKFIAFAQRFPLTRPVARAKSSDLFDLLAGFSYSQVLQACVSLRVLEHVGQGGILLSELAGKIDLPADKAELLIRAAAALDIVERDGDRVVLGQHGAAMLAQPWIMRFIEHHAAFYRDLADPVAMLKGAHVEGGLRSYWSYEDSNSDKSTYSELMAASQKAVSEQILDAYDFSQHQRMLDVGGGSGAFLKAIGARYPKLELNLFDLPGVVPLAIDARIIPYAGDFRVDALPLGMDIISIVRVVHDHDDDAVLALLKNVRRACSPQTILLIAEPFSGNPATARVTDAYFNLYFVAMGQGRTRTPAEITELAGQAGFGQPREFRTNMPIITGLMTFRPKA